MSYDKVGDVLVAQGNLPEALKSYHDSLAIRDRLAKSDPGNAGWQRDLSVSLQQGRRRAGGAGRPRRRAEILSRQPRDRDRLAKSDPGNAGWQRDLSVSYDKVGDVLVAQGNLPEALKSYQAASRSATGWPKPIPATPAGSAISRCPTTGSATCWWRRAICRGAEILSRRLAISDRLAKSDPGNAGWQRDLSVSYNKVGDVQVAQGDLAGALKSYQDSLAISRPAGQIRSRQRRLAARSLGVLREVGDVQVAQGDLAGALKSYQDGLAIRDRLAHPIPATPAGSAISRCRYDKVGDVQVAQGDLAGALKAYPRRPRDQRTGWPNPIPATPAGSAISPSALGSWGSSIGNPATRRGRSTRCGRASRSCRA